MPCFPSVLLWSITASFLWKKSLPVSIASQSVSIASQYFYTCKAASCQSHLVASGKTNVFLLLLYAKYFKPKSTRVLFFGARPCHPYTWWTVPFSRNKVPSISVGLVIEKVTTRGVRAEESGLSLVVVAIVPLTAWKPFPLRISKLFLSLNEAAHHPSEVGSCYTNIT